MIDACYAQYQINMRRLEELLSQEIVLLRQPHPLSVTYIQRRHTSASAAERRIGMTHPPQFYSDFLQTLLSRVYTSLE